MRLSEAIRLGAMLRPQGFGIFSAQFGAKATCAYGAAKDALGRDFRAVSEWPWLITEYPCPDCGLSGVAALSIVSLHLNDYHRWTRERIADWVETIENQQAESTAEAIMAEMEAR